MTLWPGQGRSILFFLSVLSVISAVFSPAPPGRLGARDILDLVVIIILLKPSFPASAPMKYAPKTAPSRSVCRSRSSSVRTDRGARLDLLADQRPRRSTPCLLSQCPAWFTLGGCAPAKDSGFPLSLGAAGGRRPGVVESGGVDHRHGHVDKI